MAETGGSSALLGWRAKNWKELQEAWRGLKHEDNGKRCPLLGAKTLTAQEAGWVFERLVMEGFRLSGLCGHHGYQVPMTREGGTKEQIDGFLVDGWQGLLVESKFVPEKIGFGPIARLHVLVEQRSSSTLGLFFSAFGYTAAAADAAELLRPIRVILFDDKDIEIALKSKQTLIAAVRRKWVLTQMHGRPYLPVTLPLDLFNSPEVALS